MDTIESVIGAGSGSVVNQLAKRFGLDENQAQAAVSQLLPALMGGVKQNVSEPGGLESLLEALQSGNHERYVDDPSTLSARETIEDGNGILGHIFGSKDRSREVASQVAGRTGIGATILKQMLPVLAGLLMGHLAKRIGTAPGTREPAPGGGITPLDQTGPTQTAGQAGMGGGLIDILKKIL